MDSQVYKTDEFTIEAIEEFFVNLRTSYYVAMIMTLLLTILIDY